MKIRALKAFRVDGIIQCIAPGECLDLPAAHALKLVHEGYAVDPLAMPPPEPAPEIIEQREPEIEQRDPQPKRKKKL